MPDEWRGPLPDERWWRGPVPVPRFVLARRGATARRASDVFPLVMVAALAGFGAVERTTVPLVGPAWSQVLAVAVAAVPVGTCVAVMQDRPFHAAWKTGVWFAFASGALYAWAFLGGWA